MSKYTDEELILLFQDGSNPNYAFNIIVQTYQQRVYQHVRRLVVDHDDANDVVQNTFIKAWKGLGNFRSEAKLFTWLYRIATNESMTFLKRKRIGTIFSMTSYENYLANKIEDSEYMDSDALLLKLQKAILSLPEKQRLVFNMRYYDELKYDEISEILGVTVGALKASYHHAVNKIEKYLKNH